MLKTNLIDKDEWKPADGFVLEDEAMCSVLSNKNTLVVAGPGAGKTELLAQRACFLLETNTCNYPKKILAISFKKDAASNLKERVELRCGKELASRFESKTYDAFAKEILDRFRNSIDELYRPLKSYNIAVENDVKNAFIASGMSPGINLRTYRAVYSGKLSSYKLPLEINKLDPIFIDTWSKLLKGDKNANIESSLTFEMISRLAEFLIRKNNYIKKAIQMTYSHVFLDEFQDTTTIQYELVKTCFLNSVAIITAVGDNKQRIMLWAGARKTIFEDFQEEFFCANRTLVMNHRSAPRLVKIQKLMYGKLNEVEIDLKTNDRWNETDGEAYLRVFENYFKEAEALSFEIEKLIEKGVELRDICILVKQQVDDYGEEIIHELSKVNIKARNESLYQDLLKEDVIKVLIAFLRLSVKDRAPDEWDYLYEILGEINGIDENSKPQKIVEFVSWISSNINDLSLKLKNIDKDSFFEVIELKVREISYEKFASKFQQYQSKTFFDSLVNDFKNYAWKEYIETKDWIKAIDNFEGKNSIPIMTIHKSKGLEYDTIFFVGLEDSAFWNFRNQPDEDRCAFFVALSRAKRRIDFTFSEERPTRFTNVQRHELINEFYEMFDDSNIVERIEY